MGAAHLAGRNFTQNGFAHAGFGNNWHNNWRGRFPHPNPGFRNWWGYGWYGPVFWPFAYDVLYADLFWPWYYDYPFWAYGYPDLYGALFWPYGYDDLAGYLPSSPGLVASTHGGTSGSVAGVRSPAPATRIARAGASRQAELTSQISQSCGEDSKEVAGWPIDRIEQTITPTADQRALFDDFANASIQAAQTIKEACPTTIAFAPTGRLDAMERRIAGILQAIDIVGSPLDKFYASLTDEQKARLNAATLSGGHACDPYGPVEGDLHAARHHAGLGQERARCPRGLLRLAERRTETTVQPDWSRADRQAELILPQGSLPAL